MDDRISYPINSLELQSAILELTASAAFGKQNPKQNIILSNSTFYNLSLEKSARTNFFSGGHPRRFEVTLVNGHSLKQILCLVQERAPDRMVLIRAKDLKISFLQKTSRFEETNLSIHGKIYLKIKLQYNSIFNIHLQNFR